MTEQLDREAEDGGVVRVTDIPRAQAVRVNRVVNGEYSPEIRLYAIEGTAADLLRDDGTIALQALIPPEALRASLDTCDGPTGRFRITVEFYPDTEEEG